MSGIGLHYIFPCCACSILYAKGVGVFYAQGIFVSDFRRIAFALRVVLRTVTFDVEFSDLVIGLLLHTGWRTLSRRNVYNIVTVLCGSNYDTLGTRPHYQ